MVSSKVVGREGDGEVSLSAAVSETYLKVLVSTCLLGVLGALCLELVLLLHLTSVMSQSSSVLQGPLGPERRRLKLGFTSPGK